MKAVQTKARSTKRARGSKLTEADNAAAVKVQELELSKVLLVTHPVAPVQTPTPQAIPAPKKRNLLFPFGFAPNNMPNSLRSTSKVATVKEVKLNNPTWETTIQGGPKEAATKRGKNIMATSEAIARQEKYTARIKGEGFDYGLTIASAFVNSIRDLGYKSVGTAINELVDNSIESGAEQIHVAYSVTKDDRVSGIAIMDDGHGMIPDMIRASVVWGGTDREGSRKLFGRYGYGLPSASVSQGKAFAVYSRTSQGDFFKVEMDLDLINEGKYLKDNKVVVPEPVKDALPQWVKEYADAKVRGGSEALRTVVLWTKLDRIRGKGPDFREKVITNLGLTYRNFLREYSIVVDGTKVMPIDPLFTTQGARFFDLDEDRAEPIDGIAFTVPDSLGVEQPVKMRLSYMPPRFFSVDKSKKAVGRNENARFKVRKENHGFIVCRNGRQIDTIKTNPLTVFLNNDRNIGIEIDFPAALDEHFGVTTAKQQITLSDTVWDRIKGTGFLRALEELRNRFKSESAEYGLEDEKKPGSAPSEKLIQETSKFIRRKPMSEAAQKEAEENQEKEIQRSAKEKGLSPDMFRNHYMAEIAGKQFIRDFQPISGNVFYSIRQDGGTVKLTYNTEHPFYKNLYSVAPESPISQQFRCGIDLLLYSMGIQELDANTEVKAFYTAEKIGWTDKLSVLLPRIEEYLSANVSDLDEPSNQ